MSREDVREPRKITAHMTVLDVVCGCRQTEKVFKKYEDQVGECICCEALFDTLADVARRYNLDLQELLSDLESTTDTRGEISKA